MEGMDNAQRLKVLLHFIQTKKPRLMKLYKVACLLTTLSIKDFDITLSQLELRKAEIHKN